jgi:hypothetical protein
MRAFRTVVALLVAGGGIVWGSATAQRDAAIAQSRKPVMVTRLFTGADGQTHAENIEMNLAQPGQSPAAELSSTVAVTGLQI